MDLFTDIASQYRLFALDAKESPCFEDWARRVAEDDVVKAWLAELPQIKQQPNLVFAAARWHGVPAPGPYDGLRRALLDDAGPIRETIMTRSTQTNEVGRLATLMPVFARIERESGRPLALLEVGTSAGLCLFPDRYDYEWKPGRWLSGSAGPVLTCDVSGDPPLPRSLPTVAWRGGIDLNPLDVEDPDAMAWLSGLVWPEQDDRRRRLAAAIDIARADPPHIVRGDLMTDLRAQIELAAPYGEVVVFHSAVAAYLDRQTRTQFQVSMMGLVEAGICRWVSNEGARVLPDVTATGPAVPVDDPTFVLGLDGQALAWTQSHGSAMRWL
ncbi:uncharacterized protein DUF2332 [Antricoccus suffuscus]|uniref:Uncharacterized protein DUF2332 n=1 Tax=Antricoccus suffuscus TaxID=1629062 RepID=A0A2T0Z371_9ACTN|nr:DUF2332 domain-containing protein [Antricoccus suffuscus]PRZ30789.1 uncharacterized protein DUF2332 [Antricoccus suffuscus]